MEEADADAGFHTDPFPMNAAHDLNDVMLDPVVFQHAARHLRFKPTVDLFANNIHHQLPRYFSPTADANAAGINAFTQHWSREWRPYANPPWPHIAKVLQQVVRQRVTIMMVVPEWPSAPWYPLWTQLCVRAILFTNAVFLDQRGQLRPKPRWNTRIGILDGNRQ